jgi:hypothetical protein
LLFWGPARHEEPPSSNAAASLPTQDVVTEPLNTPSFATDLKVQHPHWSKNEFGMVTWRLRVKNESKIQAYKDLHFKTVYWAPSGTQIDESLIGHTEYVMVPPGKTVSVQFDEFAQSQANSASIAIDSATPAQ